MILQTGLVLLANPVFFDVKVTSKIKNNFISIKEIICDIILIENNINSNKTYNLNNEGKEKGYKYDSR